MGGTKKQKMFIFSFIAVIGLTLLVVFQNCSGPVPIEFSTVSSLTALPAEVEIESLPALPEVGTRAVLQPIFYRTEKNLRDWNSLTYQWFLDGKPLPTQKSVQIVFEPLKTTDLGKYNVEIKSDTGFVLSGFFQLSGSDSNRILPETASITYSPIKPIKGGPVSLSLIPNGNKDWDYFEYEWVKSPGGVVPSAVSRTLTINSLQDSDGGGYTLKLTDPRDRTKTIFSNQLPLSIFDPSRQLPDEVQITINPNPAKAGDTVTLTASFPGLDLTTPGMGPEQYYSFQWLCKQRTCTSTSSTASLDKITMAEAGNYQVKVSLLSNRATEKTFGPTALRVDPVGCTADSDGNAGSRTVYVLANASSAADCNNAKVTQTRSCSTNDTWGAWTPAHQSDVHINCTVGTSGTLPQTCNNDGFGTSRVVYTSSRGDCAAAYRLQSRSCGANGWSLWTPSVPDPVFPTCETQAQPKTCSGSAPTRTVYTSQFAPDCNASTVKITQTGVCNTNTGTYDTWTPAAGAELSGCTNRNPCTGLNGSLIYGDENRVAYTALSASNCDNVKTSQKRTCNTNNLASGIWGDWTPSNYVPDCTPLAINANLSSSQTTCTIANGDSTCTLPLNISVQNIPTGSYVYISRTYQDSSSASQNNTVAVETNWVSSLSITRSFTLAYGTNVFTLKESSTSSSFTEKGTLGSPAIVTAVCGSSSSWSSSTQKCQTNTAPVSVPACTLSANPATVVAGGTSVLSASCTPAATSYNWGGGMASSTCVSTNATCTVTSSATTVYSATGINSSGSGNLAQAPVQVLACSYGANAPSPANLAAAGDSGTVALTKSYTQCPWPTSAVSNQTWISSISINSSTGVISYTASANSGTARSANISVPDGNTITVWQNAVSTPVCSLSATSSSISLGGSVTFTASCNPAATSYTWGNCTSSTSSPSTCTLTPSTVGTTTVTVAGTNAGGTGAAGSLGVTVNATGPGVPTGLSATAGNGQTAISFTPPVNTGGSQLSGYWASCTPTGGGTPTVTNLVTSTTITVAGLTNGVSYSCSVGAKNTAGLTSSLSSPVPVTPQAAPTNGACLAPAPARTLLPSQLCASGTPTDVYGTPVNSTGSNMTSNDDTFLWSCRGLNGGSTPPTCSSTKIVDGACGTNLPQGILWSASQLCAAGTAYNSVGNLIVVNSSSIGGSGSNITSTNATYTWSCNGKNGGNNSPCSAPRQCNGPVTSPTYIIDNSTKTTQHYTAANPLLVKEGQTVDFSSANSSSLGDVVGIKKNSYFKYLLLSGGAAPKPPGLFFEGSVADYKLVRFNSNQVQFFHKTCGLKASFVDSAGNSSTIRILTLGFKDGFSQIAYKMNGTTMEMSVTQTDAAFTNNFSIGNEITSIPSSPAISPALHSTLFGW